MTWQILGITVVLAGISILIWPRRKRITDWSNSIISRMRMRYFILLLGTSIGFFIFLVFPRPILVTTLVCGRPDCYYQLQHHRREWRALGGMDAICSVLEEGPDAFVGKGSKIEKTLSINPCIGRDDGGLNFPIPHVLALIALAEATGIALAFAYVKTTHKRRRGRPSLHL